MSYIRRLPALLLCLAMIGTSSTALAAKETVFNKVPTIKITMPKRGVDSYDTNDYTVNASAPGFLTVKLIDPSGNVIQTLMENHEIHSKSNVFDIVARTEDNDPLPPGDYTLSFDLVSQFGVASKTVTGKLTVKEIDPEVAAQIAAAKAAAAKAPAATPVPSIPTASVGAAESDVTAQTGTAPSSSAQQAAVPAAPAAPSATPVPNTTSYAAGSSVAGDEGLLIGIGVSDIATQANAGYWGLTADASDEDIWAAITQPITAVDVSEQESAYIYDSPKDSRKKIGTVSGISQGLNVIVKREDGWSLVEAFRNEDGAFVRGYIRSNKLRTSEPNQTYGLVIDKAAQTLTVFKDGARLGSCKVTTGLPTSKYLHRETPAGEFITVTRRGTIEYYGMGFTKYTVRINGSYYLCEVPTTKKNGTVFLEEVANQLGNKATRGNICIAHDASTDGGINAEWIWNMTDENKKVKVLIFDDKARTEVPQGE